MNNYELYEHRKSDTVKWIIAFTLIAVLLLGLISTWVVMSNDDTEKPADGGTEQAMIVDGDGNTLQSGKTYAMPARMVYAASTASATSVQEEVGITLTATVKPETAGNKAVDWTVSFVNANSTWAKGKNASQYVSVTPASDGATTATVRFLRAFGEQIKITVTSRVNSKASAECILDCARRITDTALYHQKLDTNILDFGSDEVLIDMVVPTYDEFMAGRSDGSIWAGGYYSIFLGQFSLTDEDMVDPLTEWADEFVSRTFRFSDYTIKDCMPVFNESASEYGLTIESTETMPAELKTLICDMAITVNESRGSPMYTFQQISRNVVPFGNNPVMMAMTMFTSSGGIGMTDFNQSIYETYMSLFIDWIQANPNTPFAEYTITYTGKYSTFTRTFSFRFNPETAVMPVFSVEVDKTEAVL